MQEMRIGAALLLIALVASGCEGQDSGGGDGCVEAAAEALPICEETRSAPETEEAIRDFVRQNAVPLRCPIGSGDWSLDVFRQAFAGRSVFLMGEAHGSGEIGPASAELLEQLALGGAVDRIAIEIPMDATEAIAEYVETGAGPLIERYDFESWPDSLFWRALPLRLRELYLAGTEIPLYGIDVPWRLAWVNEAIAAVAEAAGPEISALILDSLPDPREMEDEVDADYVAAAREYDQRIRDSMGAISGTLGPADCLRLETLARALYLGAENQWPGFWEQEDRITDPWFDDREALLFDAFRAIAVDGSERIYAHVGAYHAAKSGRTLAAMLDRDHPVTRGRIFSVVPVAGPGSELLVQDDVIDFPSAPAAVSGILSGLPSENYFLAAARPGKGCVANPFPAIAIPPGVQIDVDTTWGVAYDAFFFFRQLTPETR